MNVLSDKVYPPNPESHDFAYYLQHFGQDYNASEVLFRACSVLWVCGREMIGAGRALFPIVYAKAFATLGSKRSSGVI